jgi:ribosomal protein L40E
MGLMQVNVYKDFIEENDLIKKFNKWFDSKQRTNSEYGRFKRICRRCRQLFCPISKYQKICMKCNVRYGPGHQQFGMPEIRVKVGGKKC